MKSLNRNRVAKKAGRYAFNVLFDIGAFFSCLFVLSAVKYIDRPYKFLDFNMLYGFYAVLLLVVSVVIDKYEWRRKYGFYQMLNKYFFAWGASTLIVLLVLFIFDINYYKLPYVFVSMIGIFLFETAVISVRFAFRYAQFVEDKLERKHMFIMKNSEHRAEEDEEDESGDPGLDVLQQVQIDDIPDPEVRNLIRRHLSPECGKTCIFSAGNRHSLIRLRNASSGLLVNVFKSNYLRYINKFLEIANIKIRKNGKLIICVETLDQRISRQKRRLPPGLRHIYRFFDYMIHRVWPRMPFIRKTYFWVWRRNNKRISYAEMLGRLYSCGFVYVEELKSQNLTWFVMEKKGRPLLSYDVTYSPVIKLHRIGRGGKMIVVYKMRTMHPYSEFLQEFVYTNNDLTTGGKFRDDFRVTQVGKCMRKLWIDELPMIFNLLRGDLKLVGVRPLSRHYFSLYPDYAQEKRSKVKPGLIPPFYADLPATLDEIIDSEMRYIDSYLRRPLITDLKYFFKALNNIVFKKARSG